MPDPTPEHIILLQGILTTGQQQAKATLDLVDVFRHAEVAAQRRHDELRPVLVAYQRELDARADAVAKADAAAIAAGRVATEEATISVRVAEEEARASRAKLKAYALKLVEILFMAAVGGGAVAGYQQVNAAPQEVSP